jgi:hypothetical protein
LDSIELIGNSLKGCGRFVADSKNYADLACLDQFDIPLWSEK